MPLSFARSYHCADAAARRGTQVSFVSVLVARRQPLILNAPQTPIRSSCCATCMKV